MRRQREGWQREATRQMGRGETRQALEAYEQSGHFVGRDEAGSHRFDAASMARGDGR